MNQPTDNFRAPDLAAQNLIASQLVAKVAREDFGRLFAVLARDLRDFHLAEDCLQAALERAMVHWARSGLPHSPQGWLLQTARRKAIDHIRRDRNFDQRAEQYARLLALDRDAVETEEPFVIADERLRLIFTCCHPALDPKTRIALTLRTLCGLSTTAIARAFLDSEEAMAQRLVRARHKITKAGIPFEIPQTDAIGARVDAVRTVIYLVFNQGHAASLDDDPARAELCLEALRLARLMLDLKPDDAETEGLLALMLLGQSRKFARHGPGGELVVLEQQDRNLWDHALITEGSRLLHQALQRGTPGPYQLQAAISAIHAEAKSHAKTGWQEIVLLYDALFALSPNPVYRLNRAVALSYHEGPAIALAALAPLLPAMASYQPYHAARADLLRRLGFKVEASHSYAQAIALSDNAAEKVFLEKQRLSLEL